MLPENVSAIPFCGMDSRITIKQPAGLADQGSARSVNAREADGRPPGKEETVNPHEGKQNGCRTCVPAKSECLEQKSTWLFYELFIKHPLKSAIPPFRLFSDTFSCNQPLQTSRKTNIIVNGYLNVRKFGGFPYV